MRLVGALVLLLVSFIPDAILSEDMAIIGNFEEATAAYASANTAYAHGDMARATTLDFSVAKWLVLNSEGHWAMSRQMLERCMAARPDHREARQLHAYMVHLPEQLKIAIADPGTPVGK